MFIFGVLSEAWLFAQEPADPRQSVLQALFPIIAIGALFYFMLLRPERQRKAQMASMLDNLKKNDRIVTVGGIYGTVVNSQPGTSDVTIKVDESNNTRLRIQRSAIARVVTDEGEKNTDQTK